MPFIAVQLKFVVLKVNQHGCVLGNGGNSELVYEIFLQMVNVLIQK